MHLDQTRLERISTHLRRAVDEERLPGWAVRVNVGGATVYADRYGVSDLEKGTPLTDETIFRLFSMTKPITSVAVLALYEQGLFELRTPVSEFIPEFADTPVCRTAAADPDDVVPLAAPLTVWHLLTHTAGLTYGFLGDHKVAQTYREQGLGEPYGTRDLADTCARLAEVPLLFQPGTAWNYSIGIDVLGRIVEVASGQRLDEYLAEHVFGPLGMTETGFSVPEQNRERAAVLYLHEGGPGGFTRAPFFTTDQLGAPTMLAGGGGLFSTIADYERFTRMLASGGRTPDGRLLGPETVAYMGRNHLPGDADLGTFAHAGLEDDLSGLGFGLGVAVVRDATARRILTREGDFYWNGAGGSTFWIDRERDLSVTYFMQVRSSTNFQWEAQLHQLVHQAFVD